VFALLRRLKAREFALSKFRRAGCWQSVSRVPNQHYAAFQSHKHWRTRTRRKQMLVSPRNKH